MWAPSLVIPMAWCVIRLPVEPACSALRLNSLLLLRSGGRTTSRGWGRSSGSVGVRVVESYLFLAGARCMLPSLSTARIVLRLQKHWSTCDQHIVTIVYVWCATGSAAFATERESLPHALAGYSPRCARRHVFRNPSKCATKFLCTIVHSSLNSSFALGAFAFLLGFGGFAGSRICMFADSRTYLWAGWLLLGWLLVVMQRCWFAARLVYIISLFYLLVMPLETIHDVKCEHVMKPCKISWWFRLYYEHAIVIMPYKYTNMVVAKLANIFNFWFLLYILI